MRLSIFAACLALAACDAKSDMASNQYAVPEAGSSDAIPSAPPEDAPSTPAAVATDAPAPTAAPVADTPAPPPSGGYSGADFDPSFVCTGNLSQVETMICADRTLAGLDRQVTKAFSSARTTLDPELHAGLLADQRRFLATRNACATAECVEKAYRDRLADLQRTTAEAPNSCTAEIGQAAAARLVRQCMNVSPATHPPCNAANSCAMIEDEITRGCGFFEADDPDRPRYCDRR